MLRLEREGASARRLIDRRDPAPLALACPACFPQRLRLAEAARDDIEVEAPVRVNPGAESQPFSGAALDQWAVLFHQAD